MKVLAAIDALKSSHGALDALRRLPLPKKSDVTLLTVLEDISRVGVVGVYSVSAVSEIVAQMRSAAQRLLEDESTRLRKWGWTVQGVIREGNAAGEIVAFASEFQSDLIIVGSRGLHSVESRLLGGVAEKVMRDAPCSVLLAESEDGASTKREPVRILLAFDGSEGANAAVDLLSSWPLDDRTEIRVVSVLELITHYRMDILQRLSPIWEEEKRRAESELEGVLRALSSTPARVTTKLCESGDVSGEILTRARAFDADLIVVGAKGKRCPDRFRIGKVPGRLAHHSDCSILVVHKGTEGADVSQSGNAT